MRAPGSGQVEVHTVCKGKHCLVQGLLGEENRRSILAGPGLPPHMGDSQSHSSSSPNPKSPCYHMHAFNTWTLFLVVVVWLLFEPGDSQQAGFILPCSSSSSLYLRWRQQEIWPSRQ